MERRIHSAEWKTLPNNMIVAAAVFARILTGSPMLKTLNSANKYRGFKNKSGLTRS